MGRYQSIGTFQAFCDFAETIGPMYGMNNGRVIQYVRPNRFKVVSTQAIGLMAMTSVCDGKHVLEYSTATAAQGAQRYVAPDSISDVSSMQMMHPMFCGTLLYQFFAGPSNFDKLVTAGKETVHFGPDAVIDDVPCHTVRFYAAGLYYGHTSVAIGISDLLVHRISYDSEPLVKMMKSPSMQQQLKHMGVSASASMLSNLSSSETYSKMEIDAPIPNSAFDTTAPKGMSVVDEETPGKSTPPVSVGSPVPDFTVRDLKGKRVKLSSLRGHPVMLDFWATWCPPCRASLPETQKIYGKYTAKGLRVLAIDDEDSATIHKFVRQNHYTFHAYTDADDAASTAFKVSEIPTLVLIDPNGRLSAYFVGLQDPDDVEAAVVKAVSSGK